MSLNNLCYELLDNVVSYLDKKSIIKLSYTNKKNNKIDNEYTWKTKCKKEYPIIFSSFKIVLNWKVKYIKLLNYNCVNCNKKTKNYNEFFNIKICRKCEKNNEKYHMVSYTKAIKDYFLSKMDLSKINYINRNNPFNSSQQLKLFLKTDIFNYIKNHYGFYYYNDFRQSKISERTRKGIESLNKFQVLVTVLTNIYNISIPDVLNILFIINKYSGNLYNRYIRYNNNDIVSELIKKCLELNFIFKYTTLEWEEFSKFEDLLLFFLLMNQNPIPLNINNHIDQCISNCLNTNKDKFKRKNEILNLIYQTPYLNIINILEIPMIYSYIYYGYSFVKDLKNKINHNLLKIDYEITYLDTYTIYDFLLDDNLLYKIKKILILDNFLYEYTDISSIILDNILNGFNISKFRLSKRLLNTWYIKNIHHRHLIPSILYDFLYFSV